MKCKETDLQISCICMTALLSLNLKRSLRFSNYLEMVRIFKDIPG